MYKQLIAYDIPIEFDKIRVKIATKLLDYGLTRIQYSVFVGNISRNQLDNLKIEVLQLIQGIRADIRVFHLFEGSHGIDDIWSENKIADEPTRFRKVVMI